MFRSFVVELLDELAPNCSVKLSAAAIRKTLAKLTEPVAQGTVGMTDMGFVPASHNRECWAQSGLEELLAR